MEQVLKGITLDVAPGESTVLEVPIGKPAARAGATYWLNLSFKLNEATRWAPRGFELAWAQFEVPVAKDGTTVLRYRVRVKS